MGKAASSGNLAEDEPWAENGIYISHWKDVAPTITTRPIHTLMANDVASPAIKPKLNLPVLREVALEMGPYDIATCNGHHMALAIFNHCAARKQQIAKMPNELHTWAASVLRTLGLGMDSLAAPSNEPDEEVGGMASSRASISARLTSARSNSTKTEQ